MATSGMSWTGSPAPPPSGWQPTSPPAAFLRSCSRRRRTCISRCTAWRAAATDRTGRSRCRNTAGRHGRHRRGRRPSRLCDRRARSGRRWFSVSAAPPFDGFVAAPTPAGANRGFRPVQPVIVPTVAVSSPEPRRPPAGLLGPQWSAGRAHAGGSVGTDGGQPAGQRQVDGPLPELGGGRDQRVADLHH